MRPTARLATLVGFAAVLMWSTLAVMTAASGTVPPFQLSAMSFAVGAILGFCWLLLRGAPPLVRVSPLAWLHGVGGLFGYHFFYFSALRQAPPVEAGLINYFWPLLIVVFSAALPGERLRWFHIAGVAAGLAGTILVVTRGRSLDIDPAFRPGYLAAAAAAVTWASYSLLARRLFHVPTGAVAGFCLVTAILSAVAHLALEETVWPAGWLQWLSVLGLGLMPVGAAFYAWDYAVKRGDIQVVGASAYAAPVISTALLIATGYARPDWSVALAAVLVAGGGLLAARDMFRRRR